MLGALVVVPVAVPHRELIRDAVVEPVVQTGLVVKTGAFVNVVSGLVAELQRMRPRDEGCGPAPVHVPVDAIEIPIERSICQPDRLLGHLVQVSNRAGWLHPSPATEITRKA